MQPVIAVALSGGVDSLAAAFLLKRFGYKVFGIHFLTGFENYFQELKEISRTKEDVWDMDPSISTSSGLETIAAGLGINIKLADCSSLFRQEVVNYFITTYLSGKTPNPCLVCNPVIKFGHVLQLAKTLGASKLATGHYARIIQDSKGHTNLYKGLDTNKDQSYFLAFLSRTQLENACFPLGEMKKNDVKRLVAKNGLAPVTKSESQDICFIHGSSYADFLVKEGIDHKSGPITDTRGNIIGRHSGLHCFTVGQRKGINCPGKEPYYVTRLDTRNNTLVVGNNQELVTSSCRIEKISWVSPPLPSSSFEAVVKLRYAHKGVNSTITIGPGDQADLNFSTPQRAVTPGQGAVVMDGDKILGGGFII